MMMGEVNGANTVFCNEKDRTPYSNGRVIQPRVTQRATKVNGGRLLSLEVCRKSTPISYCGVIQALLQQIVDSLIQNGLGLGPNNLFNN